jgi:NAD(P)-dependent dehydrogenase (short-subunit alcohol dehydrogenase family)
MAHALAANGAAVLIGSPSEADNQDALDKLGKVTDQVRSRHLDVTSRESCDAFVANAVSEFQCIDIMLCNAGISISQAAFETTEDTWDRTLGVDLTGVFNSAAAAARQMKRQSGGGSIVMTSSNASLVGFPGLAAYGAAKGGVNQLMRSLAVEWGSHNIRVNAVAPGWTNHRMEGNGHKVDEAVSSVALARTPLKRFGTAEEIAAATLFLASESASFITGTVLAVDGGYTAG